MTLTFNPLQAKVTTDSQAKVKIQDQSVQKTENIQNGRTDGWTDRQTEGIALLDSLMQSVNILPVVYDTLYYKI